MSRNVKNIYASEAIRFSKEPPRRIGACIVSAPGEESETGVQDVDYLLKYPEMQTLADSLGKPVTLTCKELGVVATWTPRDSEVIPY